MIQRFIFIIVLFILLSAATATPRAFAQQTPAGKSEQPANRNVRLKGLDGKVYDISEMRGDIIVVSFGATWCTPCSWELIALEELKEEYQGQPVKFLWVSIDDPKRASKYLLREFVKERGLTFPALRDPTMQTFLQFADTTRIPVVAFFDSEGKFSTPTHRGMSSEIPEFKTIVRQRVNALLLQNVEKSSAVTATR